MQLTIDIDDELYAGIEAVAKQEHSSVSSVVKHALSRLPTLRKSTEPPVKAPHGYKLAASEGRHPFTTEDVLRIEEELYLDGKA